jgi:nucleoid-associated protein YgaU
MAFQLVTIAPKGLPEFSVAFNPSQYSIDKANQIAEAAVPGLNAPILQFVHGNTRTLTMELFFDTYEARADVRKGIQSRAGTDQVYELLEIEKTSHAPPICQVKWGKDFTFSGVLDHVSGKFTLFLEDGTPVRATLSVTFKEYNDFRVEIQKVPTESADHTKTRIVKSGDRIDIIASEEYGDAGMWRPIAEANNLSDPSRLPMGKSLVIPPIA